MKLTPVPLTCKVGTLKGFLKCKCSLVPSCPGRVLLCESREGKDIPSEKEVERQSELRERAEKHAHGYSLQSLQNSRV